MAEIGKEIRLDLIINKKKKTFVQDHIPYSKALDYTDGEAKLFSKDKDGNETEPTNRELTEYRADFVAGLFDDEELTGKVLLDGLDTMDKDIIFEIIMRRVLQIKPESETVVVDPKGKE